MSTRCLSFDFRAKCASVCFPYIFFAPFLCRSFRNSLLFSDSFSELSVFSVTKMTSGIVYARGRAAILRSSGHSVKEVAKFSNKSERWVNKWSKTEHASKTNQEAHAGPSVLTSCARNSIAKAKYKQNNLTRKIAKNLIGKKISRFRA